VTLDSGTLLVSLCDADVGSKSPVSEDAMSRYQSGGRQPCPRCSVRVPAGSTRCPVCGSRIVLGEAAAAKARAAAEAVAANRAAESNDTPVLQETQVDLSELQKQILIATLGEQLDGDPIYVFADRGPDEGEVKAGETRLYGDEAVVAVAGLVACGLVRPNGDDSYELTAQASILARSLRFRERSKSVCFDPRRAGPIRA